MPLEYLLEKYPMAVQLKGGLACEVRPLRRRDEKAMKKLYLAVPEHERLFIKPRMSDGTLFHEWCRHIDYNRNLLLLVIHKRKVIAEGTLHQRQGGWKSHIGMVSVLTHPDYRGIGLSGVLVRELVELARHAGLQRLEAEFNGERKIAIREFALAGFRELLRLPDYVKDFDATFHDYVLMGIRLKTDEEYASAG